MTSLLLRALVFLLSAAIGLLVAAALLEDVEVTAGGFVLVVVLFAVIQSLVSPILSRVAARYATALLSGVGLLATFIALLVATALGDSLTIDGGVGTWLLATVIVWLVTALATLLLPGLLRWAGRRLGNRGHDDGDGTRRT